MPDTDQSAPIEGFLSSASEARVIYVFLDMLAERVARLEQAAGLDELAALRAENRRLAKRIAAWDTPSLEHLLEFLPVIFRNVWGLVRADEVAMLARSSEAPGIRSPCPEPSGREVELGRQRLAQLPADERVRVLVAGQTLMKRHPLVIRSEMAGFFQELS
ncbi:hypothetical protein [uncultured Thiocystis sp.]|jgi:hypothetical protein|uniref:hypothetical protein n=1 Tax=uncultured Thiocystis sp. TaxID=1202134 RepID=UPI0025D2F378|nr:hypothetical protein [uncultured Thiocystis sp.]